MTVIRNVQHIAWLTYKGLHTSLTHGEEIMPAWREQKAAQNKTAGWGDLSGQSQHKIWQQREREKVKSVFVPPTWERNYKSRSSSCSSHSSSQSSSSWCSQASPSPPSHWSSGISSKNSSQHWPCYGNTSNSPMSHKFSGMGLRDVLNVTLAQEMQSLGMGSNKPLDMSIGSRDSSGGRRQNK